MRLKKVEQVCPGETVDASFAEGDDDGDTVKS